MRRFALRVSDRTEEPILTPHPRALPRAVRNGAAGGLIGRDGPSELLALQHAAGNRAVAGLMASGVVQRHPGPTTNAEVEDGTGAEAPVEGAAPTNTEETTQPGTGTTGTTGTTGAGLTGATRKKAIEDTLNASATGMWAMKIIDKWKIPVDYEYGGVGSFHRGGKIYLNKSLGIGASAIAMMHEAQHADTYISGKQADPTKLARDVYVKQSIADEAEAVVRQIEGLAVTTGLGVDMTGSSVDQGLKDRYLKAFYAKRDALRAANPAMTTAEINAICRKTTRDGEVTTWFYDGTFTVSVRETPTSYPVFYGQQWDDLSKPPAKK